MVEANYFVNWGKTVSVSHNLEQKDHMDCMSRGNYNPQQSFTLPSSQNLPGQIETNKQTENVKIRATLTIPNLFFNDC